MSETTVCPNCGQILPEDAPRGVCPECLLGLLSPEQTDEPQPGLSPESDEESPTARIGATNGRFGDYELIEELGRGGMGVVYKARQLSLHRLVALKLALGGQFAGKAFVRRFQAEAAATAILQHPNIVVIHEVGVHAGQHFFSMDYVEGLNLAQLVANRPLPPTQAARYVRLAAEAIHYAHSQGILHRDLKPSNVMIDRNDQPRITDFGLAKRLDTDSGLTVTGQMLGSPNFLPPEQASTGLGKVGPQSDVFALGGILYYLLTARAPFQGETLQMVINQVLNSDVIAPRLLHPGVPRDLETVCLKCLEKEPRRRYATAQELADDLRRFLDHEPILARPVGLPGRIWRWGRRRPALSASLILLHVVLALGLAGILWQWRRAVDGRLSARQHLYAADMLLAQKAIEADNLGRAIELLDKHRPPGTLNRQPSTQPGAPPSGGRNSRNTVTVRPQASTDLRGWEWYYLRGRCASDELATLGAHSNAVTALAFSPDGRFLATADFAGGLRLWDVPRRQLLAAFADTGREIIALAFSPDGQILATGGMDERIRIYDTATRRLALPPRLQSGWLLALAFSADGHRLQSCSREEIDRWEFPAMQRVFRAKVEAQYRVAFAPDGGTLAIGGSRGRVRLYEPATRRETNLEGHTDLIDALVFAPDGRTLYTGSSDASARAWDVATGKQIALFEGHKLDVHAVAVSLDGRSVATASSDETIRLWNARTRLQVGLLRGQNSPVWELAFAPNGQILASGGKDGQVKLWPATPRPPIVESLPLPKPVRIWKLAPDGSAFDLLTPQGTVRSLDWRSLDFLPPQPFPAELGACSPIQPGGRLRAVEEGRGVVSLWERSSGQRLDQLKGALYPARSMTFSPDGQTLAIAAYERDLQLWHVPTCRLIRPLIGPTNTVSGPLSFSPDGRQLAALYLDGYVAVWNLARPQFPAIWRAHGMFVHAGTFSPDGRWLATGAGDGLAKIWEISTRREIKTLPVSLLSVLSLAFSPDGRRLAAAGSDGTVTLFDLATFQPIAHFHGHADPSLYGLAFWPDGTTLVSVSLKDIVIRRAPTLAESLKRSPPRGDE